MSTIYTVKGKGFTKEISRDKLIQILKAKNPQLPEAVDQIQFNKLAKTITHEDLELFLSREFGIESRSYNPLSLEEELVPNTSTSEVNKKNSALSDPTPLSLRPDGTIANVYSLNKAALIKLCKERNLDYFIEFNNVELARKYFASKDQEKRSKPFDTPETPVTHKTYDSFLGGYDPYNKSLDITYSYLDFEKHSFGMGNEDRVLIPHGQYGPKPPNIKAPTFGGRTGESIREFFEDFEEYARNYNYEEKHKIQYLVSFLEGDARKHFRNNKDEYDQLGNWDALKKALVSNFSSIENTESFSNFFNRKQSHSESALSYFEDKVNLLKNCTTKIPDAEVVEIVMSGFLPNIKGILKIMRAKNLKELKEHVKTAVSSESDLRKGDIFQILEYENVQGVQQSTSRPAPHAQYATIGQFEEIKTRVEKIETTMQRNSIDLKRFTDRVEDFMGFMYDVKGDITELRNRSPPYNEYQRPYRGTGTGYYSYRGGRGYQSGGYRSNYNRSEQPSGWRKEPEQSKETPVVQKN